MTIARSVEYHVRARGSTDAADKAKAEARSDGLRILTVSSIRPLGDVVPAPQDEAHWVAWPQLRLCEACVAAIKREAPVA